MIKQLSIAMLAGLTLAACSELPKEVPIEDRAAKSQIGTAAPAADVGQAGAGGATMQTAGMATTKGDAKQAVETQALPPAATQVTPLAGGAGQGASGLPAVWAPDAHKDPAGPLAKRLIYYEFDSAVIASEFQPLIEAHASYLKANKTYKIILQGHADERGSREYNLALGQRRSESVRQAMTLLGVPDDQMEAVSMGEEKPAAEGHDEAAWKQNRRTEIHYQGE